MIDENTSRQVEELYRSDDWAELRWAREHSTPQQIARHLLDPQWRDRDYNALDELVEMTHDADLSSLDEDDLETLAASGLPELRQAIIRYAGTPARLLEDMARTESNTRLLQMLVESGKLSQNAIDLCCWNQTDSRLAASMLTKASDDLLHRLSGRDWWPSRKNAVESGRLDRKDLDDMIKTENHPDVVSALIGTGEFDMDSEVNAIRRVIISPGLLTTYTNPMNRRYSLDQSQQEVVRQAARTMLEHAPVGMILSMPDDDDENWRTLIDTAATEYAGELGKDMLGLIAQSEGNTQARTILAGRGFPKAAASNAERTLAASPGADGTYGFNLRLLGRLKDDVDYFLGPSHAEKYLWAGSVDAQIAKLREIDGTIRPEDRPEWFTTEWIDQAEREMKDPSDNTGTALDAALSGQYAAFENAVIGYIDAHDTDAGTSENGASQFAGYEVAARDANGTPMAYRLDWFDDEGMVHEGPEATETELRSLREGIFDSPDSWDSFNTATDTPDTTAADTSGTAGTKPGHETGHGPQIVFTSLAGGHGMPEGTVELLSDDADRQVSDILDAGGTSGGRPERAAGQDRERRRENIDRLLDVLPVTMVTKDGNHQVTAEEVMAMADRTEHAADMAEEPETAAASSTDTPAEPFDWNGVDGLESGIRDWYSHEFPGDPEGEHIDPQTTFREAVESFPMGDGHDFYAVTGVVDSIVRGRVFEELSSRLDCEYSDIYDAWLHRKSLNPTLLGTKSTRMRHDIEDMLGGDAESFTTVDAIADRMASDPHLRAIIREADKSTAIGSHDFETGLKDAIGDQPRIERLMDDGRLADLIYDMVHDEHRFDASGHAVTVTAETLWTPDEFQSMMELITRVSDRLADDANVQAIMGETTSAEEEAEAGLGQLIDDEIDIVSHDDPDMARAAEDEYVADGRFAQTVYRRLANIRSERSETEDNDTETAETDDMGKTPTVATDSDAPDVTGYDMEETVERLNRIRTGDDDPIAKAHAVNAVSDIVAADSATNALITNPGNDKKAVLDEGRLRAVVTTALTSMTVGESDGFAEAISGPDAADQIAGQVYDLVAGNRRYDIDGLVAYLASDDDSATAETLEDRPEDMPVESESTDDTHAETGTDEVSDDEPDVDFGSPERELAAEIVMQEGGTRQEVREHFSDAELDRIARDEMDAETPDDAGTENDVADTADDLSPEDKERIAGKVRLFGIKVGQFEVARLLRRGATLMQIADIADSYDRNRRVGMDRDEARAAAEREHGYTGEKPRTEVEASTADTGTDPDMAPAQKEPEPDATEEKDASAGEDVAAPEDVPESGRRDEPVRTTVAATVEAEQLAFDFDDMPTELDSRQNRGENYSQTKLDTVSNSGSSHETEENDARKETTRNDGHALPVPGDQEDEVPVHGGASAGTAQGTQEAGDAGVGRLHGPGPEGLRPDDHRVRQPLGQDAPAPQAAGQLGPVVQGAQDGGASGRGGRHQERDRSPLTRMDRGLLDPDLQATGSSLERARANVHAIEVLRDLDDSGREPTEDDIRALAAYAGWGGAQKAFEEDGANPAWSGINTRLRGLLTDAEYADARSSTLTAFYTPRPVVDAMWQALGKAGFGRDPKHPDMVLEPGCGTGNFIRSTPDGSSYAFTGIEADPISAGIARYLCPDDDIINNRMERTGLPTDAFDLAIGNVPYSDAIRIDGTVIHDWFIQHSLDTVRPGGLVAVLTSRYTLDKNTSNMRRELARKAELVAACRLPRETFDRQAGTEVVSDILILRKRDEPLADADVEWEDTTEFRDGVTANRLFVDHPEYVAGTMTVGSGPFGPQIDVTGTGDITRLGGQVERILTSQLEEYGIGLHDRLGERANEPIVVPDKTQQTAMRYMVDANNHIWYGDMDGQLVPAHSRVRKGGDARMADMLRLRDQTERLLAIERDPNTADTTVAQSIRDLDEAYDRFVASWGRLNSKENLRVFDPNNSDPSLNQLYTLEKTGPDGFEAKGDMLSKRVVTPVPPMPEHVREPVDAMAISLDRVGHVDLDLIGRLLDTRDDIETIEKLGDLIVMDPDTGMPLPADEYLSGDVGGKLDHVDGLLRDLVGQPERTRIRQWLADNDLQDMTPPASVEGCRRELVQTGAWQSATDPIHARKSVAEAPWFSNVLKEHGRGQRRAFASMFLDDCKPGVDLLEKNWNAQRPQGNNLFDTIFDSGWSSDDEGASSSAMRMLYKAVTADPKAIDDRTIATILNTSGFKSGPVRDALRKVTDPSLWEVEDHGYYKETKCDYLALAKELRAHPETCEYLYAADVDRLAHPTIEKRYGRYNSWNQKTFKPLDEMVDMEGLEQWRSRRNAWMRAHPDEPADMDRLKSLQSLRERLAQGLPARLTHDDITAKLGSAWIPTGVIRDFMIDTFGLNTQPNITDGGMRSLSVSHDETTGNWQVNASLASKLDEETIRKYGLGTGAGRNPFEIVSGALNSTTSNLTKPDPNDPTGKKRVRDPQATALLYQKRHTIEQAFTEWVWTDPARTRMLEDVYNERFNRIHPREYDGSYLTFPGISADIDLYPHQRKAVARILQSEEGTLVAHVVGAGKTFTGVAACHEAKRLGRASKPMIVVPNHLTEQWAKDYLTLYPDANILSMTEADGTGKGAARFWAKVAAGDWDAVIVRQDTFQRMHVSPERRENYFSRRKAEMLKSIETAKSDGNDFSAKKLKDEIGKMEKSLNRTVKQAEKDRMRVDGKLQALRGGEDNKEWIDFEDLGVDMLFVDEAHQFKNLAIATTISVPGVDVAAAQKCEDLFDKCEYLREAGHGSNIVFATGTPVSNSMAELYNMQRYLAPDLLKAQGVEAFTSWANTYGSIVESVEVKPEGSGYQIKQRFAKFHNLPELMSTFHDYADLLTADKLDLDVPDCEVVSVAVEATEAQKQAVDALVERAELVRDGAVDPSDDNMLNITNDGRKVSLDPKLLDVSDPDIQPMEGGKVQVCAEKIHEIWQEHAEEKATQLVFCDSSTTASGKWNIQSDLKRRLVDLGIPEDEIMFAAQEKDPQRKQALFEKVRKGEVRVLIGSTGTLGTGTNVQDRLFAIHDLDCPWKPAELEQRQGRVRRQGNMFDNVQDYRYITVGTFDSYMFQTVERKARFISQIMSSGSPSREASDVDATVLSLADMKAIATGDPNIAKRMELENQLTQMKLLKRAHADQQRSIRFKIDMQLQPTVDHLERLHGEALDDEPKFREAVEIRGRHLTRGICGLDLGDGPIADRRQAIHDLVGIARRLDHGQTMEVGEYCGMTVMVASKNMAVKGLNVYRPFVGLKGEHEHWAGTSMPDINNSADNVIRQLDRIIANNTDTAQSLGVKLDKAKASLDSAWTALNTPWEGQKEYDDLTDQIAKMNLEIKNGQDTAPSEENEQDMQADLAEASYHSDDPEEPHAVRTAEAAPTVFPTTVEETDVPMPDPCVDPAACSAGGPGIGM
ncbi:MAG: DEAD/DEAH box helicase family protein [Bifidobacterium sp.]|uniref:LPD11 domain-containing protein n=1 Tax=Bifidobacterium sp. TaxID=41200 RepID=UPI00284E19DA|nr:LPD11 domain-containing protein [Bifidobacterium sp.]MDR3912106.1 DEAD/DEAH box helicase family protein [Bifidobacterium sp.]